MSLLLFGTGEEESMAAPTFVTHATTSVSASTSLTVTKPASVQNGDYLLVHIQHGTGNLAADPTAPTGWALIGTRQANSSTTAWLYERVASSEPASWDWTNFSSGVIFGGIQVWRGADQTTPRNTEHITQNTAIGGTSIALTVTTTVADCGLACFVGQDQTAAGATYTQASMTELYDADFETALLHCGAYHETATTATTYARTVTYTAERCNGFLVAIAPASGTDLVVQNSAQAQSAGNVTLTQVHNLTVAAATQGQAAGNVSLTQVHNLVVQGATQAQTAGSVALTQAHNLAVASATQAQAADNVTLNIATNLTVQSADQAQAAQQVTLTQTHNLAVQGATQAQSAGNVTLTQAHNLVVQGAGQAQAAGSVSLTQTHVLVVAGAIQGQTATTITLSLAPPRDITVVAKLRSDHVTGGVRLTGLSAKVRSNHITGGVTVPRGLQTGSVEYVIADVTFEDLTAADIATATGQVQITTTDTTPPANDANWANADVTERTDVNGGALLALKKLHTAGAAGEYRVWAKVSDNPEVPILKCGSFTVR